MRSHSTVHQLPTSGEDAETVVRAIFALTAGVGGMLTGIAVAGDQLPLIALPTTVLIGCLCFDRLSVAAYVAAGVWLALAPAASGEALLAPLSMILLCLAIAVGPDRLVGWLARDATPVGRALEDAGWIEDGEHPMRMDGAAARTTTDLSAQVPDPLVRGARQSTSAGASASLIGAGCGCGGGRSGCGCAAQDCVHG